MRGYWAIHTIQKNIETPQVCWWKANVDVAYLQSEVWKRNSGVSQPCARQTEFWQARTINPPDAGKDIRNLLETF
jgi:hypothetical protein